MPGFKMPSQYALAIIDIVEEQTDNELALKLQREFNLENVDIDDWVDTQHFVKLVNQSLKITGDSGLGLKLGCRLNITAHGAVGLAMMNASTLAESLELLSEYEIILAATLPYYLEKDTKRRYISIWREDGIADYRFSFEVFCGLFSSLMAALLQSHDRNLRIEFPYPEPAYSKLYREYFGEDLHFSAPQGRISYDLALEKSSLPCSNSALCQFYKRICDKQLQTINVDTATQRVMLKLWRNRGEYPSLDGMAKKLGMSKRTLSRHLSLENTNYQSLLNKVRIEHAEHYLKHSDLSVESIAIKLGYSDPANFKRAFRRWTGRSCHEFKSDCSR